MSREHKHKIKLAFNDDEIISYCEDCGNILDVYKRVRESCPVYYPVYQYYPYYPYYLGQPTITCTGSTTSTTVESAIPSIYSTEVK